MAKTREFFGKECRYCYDMFCWVPEDGSFVILNLKGRLERLKISRLDKEGKWAKHPWAGHSISVARAVITCYCPPKPDDGKKYEIAYRDCNPKNCHRKNLYWKEYHYQHCSENSIKLHYDKTTVEIFRDGSVKVRGKKAKILDWIYDSDMNLYDSFPPYIEAGIRDRVFLRDMVKDAGFVNGDDAGMKDPQILHRDHDWLNFAADNLEWIERDDPRYQEYMEQKSIDMDKRKIELNPDRQVPDFYLYTNRGIKNNTMTNNLSE